MYACGSIVEQTVTRSEVGPTEGDLLESQAVIYLMDGGYCLAAVSPQFRRRRRTTLQESPTGMWNIAGPF